MCHNCNSNQFLSTEETAEQFANRGAYLAQEGAIPTVPTSMADVLCISEHDSYRSHWWQCGHLESDTTHGQRNRYRNDPADISRSAGELRTIHDAAVSEHAIAQGNHPGCMATLLGYRRELYIQTGDYDVIGRNSNPWNCSTMFVSVNPLTGEQPTHWYHGWTIPPEELSQSIGYVHAINDVINDAGFTDCVDWFSHELLDCDDAIQLDLGNGHIVSTTPDNAIDNGYEQCARSGEWCDVDDMITVIVSDGRFPDTELWAESEADEHSWTCDCCGDRYSNDCSRTTYDGHSAACRRCIDSGDFYFCEDCGECYSDYSDSRSCCGRSGGDVAGRYSYHGDPIRRKWDEPSDSAWGIEIEANYNDTEDCETAASRAHSLGWACEEDGSLDDDTGMELISPTYDSWQECKEAAESIRYKISRLVDQSALDGYDSIGIHISANSAQWGRLHAAKIAAFVRANPGGLCELIAGRSVSYARYYKLDKQRHAKHIVSACCDGQHFAAVSYASHGGRMEFRIFKTSTDKAILASYFDFIRSVELFCKAASFADIVECKSTLADQYLCWLAKSGKEFRPLRKRFGELFADLSGDESDDIPQIALAWHNPVKR